MKKDGPLVVVWFFVGGEQLSIYAGFLKCHYKDTVYLLNNQYHGISEKGYVLLILVAQIDLGRCVRPPSVRVKVVLAGHPTILLHRG